MIENDYTVFVTYKCNWNCEYCIVNTHNQPKILFSTVLEKVNKIPNGSSIKLMGGEPGMLDENEMKQLFDLMIYKGLQIFVITNGTFINRHFNYIKYCKEILYHCSENMEEELVRYEYDNVVYQLTVTDKNIINFKKFIEKNNDIKFVVYAAQVNPAGGPTLSRKNSIQLAIKYKDKISKDSIVKLMDNCTDESEYI